MAHGSSRPAQFRTARSRRSLASAAASQGETAKRFSCSMRMSLWTMAAECRLRSSGENGRNGGTGTGLRSSRQRTRLADRARVRDPHGRQRRTADVGFGTGADGRGPVRSTGAERLKTAVERLAPRPDPGLSRVSSDVHPGSRARRMGCIFATGHRHDRSPAARSIAAGCRSRRFRRRSSRCAGSRAMACPYCPQDITSRDRNNP